MTVVEDFRADLDELARLAAVDLDVLWRQVSDAETARALLSEVLPGLLDVYGSAAGTIAADWYEELRPDRGFRARVAPLPEPAQLDALAGYSANELLTNTDPARGLVAVKGGAQRLIANVARSTVTASSLADPQALGWQRSAAGGCGFCQLLASRGAVYSSASVDFGAHDHCRCVAVPAFDGGPLPVKPYTPSAREVTDADRARTRQWMREHGY